MSFSSVRYNLWVLFSVSFCSKRDSAAYFPIFLEKTIFEFCSTPTENTNKLNENWNWNFTCKRWTTEFITIFNVNKREKCGPHHELCATKHLFPIYTNTHYTYFNYVLVRVMRALRWTVETVVCVNGLLCVACIYFMQFCVLMRIIPGNNELNKTNK